MRNQKILSVSATIALLVGSIVVASAYEETKVDKPGTISGEVTFDGTAPKPTELKVTKDKQVCAQTPKYDKSLVVAEGKVVNAVVLLTDIQRGKALETTKVVLDQKGCEYQPHVLAVKAGTPIEILNPDKILHNVHTYSEKNRPINKAMPKFKRKLTVKFEKPEAISVKCDVHGWMDGWLFVTDNPYYSVTDENGKFHLSEVPPGTYTLEVWHETLGKQSRQITVEPNGQVTTNFAMAKS